MFCGNCGTPLPENALACPNCGSKVENTESEQTSDQLTSQEDTSNAEIKSDDSTPITSDESQAGAKKGKPLTVALSIATAVLAALIIIIVVIFAVGRGSTQKGWLIGSVVDDSLALFWNNLGETKEIDDIPYNSYISLSGNFSVGAYITETDSTLYCIDSSLRPVKIADDVLKVQMSLSGDYIVYGAGDDLRSCELFIYNVKTAENTKLSSNVSFNFTCISPSGRTVAYVKNYENDLNNDLYISSAGKESIKVDKDGCFPVAISDDGKNFFYLKFKDSTRTYDLQYYNGKKSTRLTADIENRTMYTNGNVNELLYYKDSRTYFYSTDQAEPQRVNSNSLLPLYTDTFVSVQQNPSSVTYDIDSLTDSYYIASSSLVWLDRNGSDTVRIASKWNNYKLSKDGHSLLYWYKDELYRAAKFSASAEAELLCDDLDITNIIASGNLSRIYLITDDDELYYYRGNKHIIRLSNDLQDTNHVAYSEANKKIYFIENDNLYRAATDINSKEKVAQDITRLMSLGGVIMFSSDDGDMSTIYMIKDSEVIEVYSEYVD